MNIGEIRKGDALYKQAYELRYLLFFKEHSLPKETINDDKENKSTHIAISKGHELIAYGRLSEIQNNEFQISQMVVSPIHQHQGYGEKLLLKIMLTAKDKDANTIMLNARITAVSFYKKFGFQQVGQVYSSQHTGVPHIKMVYHENA